MLILWLLMVFAALPGLVHLRPSCPLLTQITPPEGSIDSDIKQFPSDACVPLSDLLSWSDVRAAITRLNWKAEDELIRVLRDSFVVETSRDKRWVRPYPREQRLKFVQSQLVFYFSDVNYETRAYPRTFAEDGWVRADALAGSGRMRAMGVTEDMLLDAARGCLMVQVREEQGDTAAGVRQAPPAVRVAAQVAALCLPAAVARHGLSVVRLPGGRVAIPLDGLVGMPMLSGLVDDVDHLRSQLQAAAALPGAPQLVQLRPGAQGSGWGVLRASVAADKLTNWRVKIAQSGGPGQAPVFPADDPQFLHPCMREVDGRPANRKNRPRAASADGGMDGSEPAPVSAPSHASTSAHRSKVGTSTTGPGATTSTPAPVASSTSSPLQHSVATPWSAVASGPEAQPLAGSHAHAASAQLGTPGQVDPQAPSKLKPVRRIKLKKSAAEDAGPHRVPAVRAAVKNASSTAAPAKSGILGRAPTWAAGAPDMTHAPQYPAARAPAPVHTHLPPPLHPSHQTPGMHAWDGLPPGMLSPRSALILGAAAAARGSSTQRPARSAAVVQENGLVSKPAPAPAGMEPTPVDRAVSMLVEVLSSLFSPWNFLHDDWLQRTLQAVRVDQVQDWLLPDHATAALRVQSAASYKRLHMCQPCVLLLHPRVATVLSSLESLGIPAEYGMPAASVLDEVRVAGMPMSDLARGAAPDDHSVGAMALLLQALHVLHAAYNDLHAACPSGLAWVLSPEPGAHGAAPRLSGLDGRLLGMRGSAVVQGSPWLQSLSGASSGSGVLEPADGASTPPPGASTSTLALVILAPTPEQRAWVSSSEPGALPDASMRAVLPAALEMGLHYDEWGTPLPDGSDLGLGTGVTDDHTGLRLSLKSASIDEPVGTGFTPRPDGSQAVGTGQAPLGVGELPPLRSPDVPMYGMPTPGALSDVLHAGHDQVRSPTAHDADMPLPPLLRTQSMQIEPDSARPAAALASVPIMSWDVGSGSNDSCAPLTPAVAPLAGPRTQQPLAAQVRRITQAIDYYSPQLLCLHGIDSAAMSLWLQRALHSLGYELVRAQSTDPAASVSGALVAWRRRVLQLQSATALPASGLPAVALQHVATGARLVVAPADMPAHPRGEYDTRSLAPIVQDGAALLDLSQRVGAQAVVWNGRCAGGPGSVAYDLLSRGVVGDARLVASGSVHASSFHSLHALVAQNEPHCTTWSSHGAVCEQFLWLRPSARAGLGIAPRAVLQVPSKSALDSAGPMPNQYTPTAALPLHAVLDVLQVNA